MSDKSSDGKNGFLSTGTLSIGIGVLLKTITLPMLTVPPMYPIFFIGIGTICAAMYFHRKNEWTELMEVVGIKNSNDQVPKHVKVYKTMEGEVHEFTLPDGLSLKDFESRVEPIGQSLGEDVKFVYDRETRHMRMVIIDRGSESYQWYSLFRALKLGDGDKIQMVDTHKSTNSVTYEFTLPIGMSVQHFINKQEPMEQYLKMPLDINYDLKSGHIMITTYMLEHRTINFKPVKVDNPAEVLIGYDREGNVVTVDLGDGEPHMYIAGETGCGKSTTLWSMITNMMIYNDVEFWLGDMKGGVEFNLFYGCPKVTRLATTIPEITEMFGDVEKEIKARLALFKEHRVRNIKAYRNKVGDMKYKFIIIDELAQITYGKDGKEAVAALERISAMARACGIHLIIGTQRPDKEVLNGRIKINFANIIGMKTKNRVNSMVILDHDGCESLEVGQAIFSRGLKEVYVQIPLITDEQAEQLISKLMN
jgi:S-DNA-T family DNA segregation ATPase FtsK/SpoIIIE